VEEKKFPLTGGENSDDGGADLRRKCLVKRRGRKLLQGHHPMKKRNMRATKIKFEVH